MGEGERVGISKYPLILVMNEKRDINKEEVKLVRMIVRMTQ